jgi:hypothetical protein
MFSVFVPCSFFLLPLITDILILFSFTILSNSSSFPASPLTFQVAYLHRDIFHTSTLFKENLSSFFLRDLPLVKISPELVMGPEQGKSSGRVATFSL